MSANTFSREAPLPEPLAVKQQHEEKVGKEEEASNKEEEEKGGEGEGENKDKKSKKRRKRRKNNKIAEAEATTAAAPTGITPPSPQLRTTFTTPATTATGLCLPAAITLSPAAPTASTTTTAEVLATHNLTSARVPPTSFTFGPITRTFG